MTKLIRKHQKVFAENANSNELSIFGSLKAGIPAYSNDPDNIQSAEYLRGLFGAVIGDNSPAIEDHNSLFYLFSRQLAYLFQQGIAEWDSATEYHTGSLCSLSTEVGKIYVSRTDTNVNHSPTGTNWQLYWYVFDLNKLEKYTPFCVNSGNTDADGNGDLISFTGNTLSFKIGGSYVNMGATTANGTHFEISNIDDISWTATSGTFYIFIKPNGDIVIPIPDLEQNPTFYVQKSIPYNPLNNSIWLDTSKEQLIAYQYNESLLEWIPFDGVPFAKIVNGIATTLPFNYNGYTMNRYSLTQIQPRLSEGVGIPFDYTIPRDGNLYVGGTSQSNNWLYLSVNSVNFVIVSSNSDTIVGGGLFVPVKKGDVISLYHTFGTGSLTKSIIYYANLGAN